MLWKARTSTTSAAPAHTNRYTGSARSSASIAREKTGPVSVPFDARDMTAIRAAASRNAGTYIKETNQVPGSGFPVLGSGFWVLGSGFVVLGRSGKTSVKWSSSGGSSATATVSAQ